MGLSRLLDQRKPYKMQPTGPQPRWAFAIGLLHGLDVQSQCKVGRGLRV